MRRCTVKYKINIDFNKLKTAFFLSINLLKYVFFLSTNDIFAREYICVYVNFV